MPPAPPDDSAVRRPAEGGIICRECGAHSPSGYRFCLGCGAVLNREAAKVAPQPAPGPATRTDRPALVLPPILGATPSVPPSAASRTLVCGRCGGTCDQGEAFCKHCGAVLEHQGGAHDGSAGEPRRRAMTQAVVSAAAGVVRATETERPIELTQRARSVPPARESDAEFSDRPPFVQVDTGSERAVGRLVVIVEDGSEGKSLRLTGRQIDIGRIEGDVILSEDNYLSPRHARLYREGDDWYVRDLDSLNGVYRRLRRPHVLRDRDLVLLGLEVLQFELVPQGERGLGHASQHGTLLFGSPAATRRARLCQRTVEGIVRDVYHLVSDETTIGREIGDLVFTSDPFMSRRHAVIRWQEASQQYVLADLNSSNGTYCAVREDVKLQNGDFVRLGQHLFRVDLPQKTGQARA